MALVWLHCMTVALVVHTFLKSFVHVFCRRCRWWNVFELVDVNMFVVVDLKLASLRLTLEIGAHALQEDRDLLRWSWFDAVHIVVIIWLKVHVLINLAMQVSAKREYVYVCACSFGCA